MISYVKVMNTEVVQLIKIYNFYFGYLIIWQILKFKKRQVGTAGAAGDWAAPTDQPHL